jgi:hypothetical protein
MTNSEIHQCILDIKSWFLKKTSINVESASTVDLQRLHKAIDTDIPNLFKLFLSEINGGIYFLDKEFLQTNKIIEIQNQVEKSKRWRNGLLPFCGDEDSLLVIDTLNNDEILEWDSDDGIGNLISPNFIRFLENFRNGLLSGQYEFVEDIGMIEKITNTQKSHK